MPRSVDEWQGHTDDTPVPKRVRLRVFERVSGKCHRCGLPVRPGKYILEHVIAIINGGQNREGNLHLTCNVCLPTKNAEDVKLKAKSYRLRARAAGIRKPRTITRWRNMRGEIVERSRER